MPNAADKERTRVAQHSRHMPHQFVGCPHVRSGSEVREILRCSAQCFLRAVRNGGKKVPRALLRSIIIHRIARHQTLGLASTIPRFRTPMVASSEDVIHVKGTSEKVRRGPSAASSGYRHASRIAPRLMLPQRKKWLDILGFSWRGT